MTASLGYLDAAAQKPASTTSTTTTTTTTTTTGRAATGAAAATARLAQLRKEIDAILAGRSVSKATWGVAVKSLAADRVIYDSGADKLLLPASNMKVITLAAAAERLGWDYTFKTELRATGRIADGILEGDLVIVGGGDPNFDNWGGAATALFFEWAAHLKSLGVSRINGRIIGDDDVFDDEPFGAGWSWDDADRSFAAPISGLQFNENSTQVTVAPGWIPGEAARVILDPPGSGLDLRGNVRTSSRGGGSLLTIRRIAGTPTLVVDGSIAAASAPVVRNVAVVNPTMYFAGTLREVLLANQISVAGGAIDIDDLTAKPARTDQWLIGLYQSPPLHSIATTMMNLSQNLFAESLLKTLGSYDGPGSAVKGRAVVEGLFKKWGVAEGDISIADGSGLSRYNLVTADALASILTYVARTPELGEIYEGCLPVAASSGTLETRFRNTAAAGIVHAKTGSLSTARALSGYVRPPTGEPLAFSILVNNFGGSVAAAESAMDAIVVRLAKYATGQ